MLPMNQGKDGKRTAFYRGSFLGDLALGAAIGVICLGASFLAGVKLIGKLYYVEWLAVSVMGFLLLVAWLLYLKDDAFMRRRAEKSADETTSSRSGSARSRRVLFAAAALLGLSSLILYFLFGIGASL